MQFVKEVVSPDGDYGARHSNRRIGHDTLAISADLANQADLDDFFGIALGWVEPDEIARAGVFLASDNADAGGRAQKPNVQPI